MDPAFYNASNAPINEDGPIEFSGWYFWDEVWAHYIGPFPTEDQCRRALEVYCEQL